MRAVQRCFRLGVLVLVGPSLPLLVLLSKSFLFRLTRLSLLAWFLPLRLTRTSKAFTGSQPRSGTWVTAVPSSLDGTDTLIRPRAFRVACRLRLGIPIWREGASCPCCMQTLDIYGDHAVCCNTGGDLIVRHNRVRDLVDKFAREGHLSPVMEKKGILGDAPGRRPGDVSIPLWSEGKGLAIDVAVTFI
jgi:hypothetical protein